MKLDSKYLTRRVIDDFIKSYKRHKLIVYEDEMGYRHKSYYEVIASYYIVRHVEGIIATIDESHRFILEKEVIEGLTGNWYMGYFSVPSYYRHRKAAYAEFLRCLDD